ncbi:hypothetical protein A3A70_02425 [candidate division WWE3 bacterium RIFCSPLOWO2_01_FULL_42_11]|uniref:Uncharacterized protein n=1 Tax=candidate division WWE3 bacterium RIFCSPLOWO2_01_FULL_42_11 TaxID=1802627 RepID=A0A1F4VSA2_UNCKA|nr:MAG: hypothetical protein A3A70_02425 [candidate division WWE3 bacterium RIFCSPLOWO2_01_FULL_42_11]
MWPPLLTLSIIEPQESRLDTISKLGNSITLYFHNDALLYLGIAALIGVVLLVGIFYGYSKAVLVTMYSVLGLGVIFTVNLLMKPQQDTTQAKAVIVPSEINITEEEDAIMITWNTDIPSSGALILGDSQGQERTYFALGGANKSLRHEVLIKPKPDNGMYKIRLLINGRPDEGSIKSISIQ